MTDTTGAASGPGVRHASEADMASMARIYNHYILNTTATFEVDKVTPKQMTIRVQDVRDAGLPWLVVGSVAGYAYATRWRPRQAYRYAVEVSAYIDPALTGKGLGSILYTELFRLLRERGVHAAMGGITLPNDASVAFHEKFGMKKVAHFSEVGYKFDRWIDVGYWQRIIIPGRSVAMR
ncbi:MAG: N-acetyltransferase family protein [Cyclonatronaceae bacterium]